MDGIDALLRPIDSPRLHEQIASQIEKLIVSGDLEPGDRLPAERHLAERFGVSRNSVRDALRTLETRGVVDTRRGAGSYVREVSATELYHELVGALMPREKRIWDALLVRRIIEPGIAYYAAQNAEPEQLDELEAIVERHEATFSSDDPRIEEDALFHHRIAEMTGNELLVELLDVLDESLRETRSTVLMYEGSRMRLGHRRILDALKEGDSERARSAMLAHIEEVVRTYQSREEIDDLEAQRGSPS